MLVSRDTASVIGELCVSGDWACAQGDLSTLRHIAHRLAVYAPEPLHCELVEIADACNGDPARAEVLWDRIKSRVYRSSDS